MNVKIYPSRLDGVIDAIPSKSYAHRLLLCAALADAPCRINLAASSEDIDATVRCIVATGAAVCKEKDGFKVTPVRKKTETSAEVKTLDCGESGTTLRFMLPAVCAVGGRAVLTGKGRLPERPIGGLADCLVSAGIRLSSDRLPIEVSGILTAGEYEIAADVSSQYVSGMLIALASLDAPSRLRLKGRAVSSGYTDMTLDVLEKFGAKITRENDGYLIAGGGLHSPGSITTEGDWSNAAFWLAAGALNGDVTVCGLNFASRQRDSAIAEILREMGADIRTCADGLSLSDVHGAKRRSNGNAYLGNNAVSADISARAVRAVKSSLRAVTVDITDIPDLAPILSVLMAAADGVSVMSGTERLRAKESDRLSAVIDNLTAAGIRTAAEKDILKIYGGTPLAFRAEGFGDHRMVMSACIAGSLCGGEVTDGGAVAKSYPAFYRDFASLGGHYENI